METYPKEFEICVLDKPTKTGNVFPTAVVQDAVTQLGKPLAHGIIGGTIGMPEKHPDMTDDAYFKKIMTIDPTQQSHKVTELAIKEGFLVGKIRPLKTERGQLLTKLIEKDVVAFRLAGLVNMSDHNTVSQLTITSINAVMKDLAA